MSICNSLAPLDLYSTDIAIRSYQEKKAFTSQCQTCVSLVSDNKKVDSTPPHTVMIKTIMNANHDICGRQEKTIDRIK